MKPSLHLATSTSHIRFTDKSERSVLLLPLYRQRADNKQTNLGILLYSNRAHVTVARRQSCDHTIPRQQGNLRLTHFQCSQYVWSRNQGRITSICAADSVTFAERVRVSKSRSPYVVHKSCEHCSQKQQRVAPSSTCLSQSRIEQPMVRTSRFTFLKFFLAYNPSSPSGHSLVGHNSFVVRRTVTNLSLLFAFVQHVLFCSNSPLCFLQNFL